MDLSFVARHILPDSTQVSVANVPQTLPCNGNPLPVVLCVSPAPLADVNSWAVRMVEYIQRHGFSTALNPTSGKYQYPVFVGEPATIARFELGAILLVSDTLLETGPYSAGADVAVLLKGNKSTHVMRDTVGLFSISLDPKLPTDHHTDGEQEEYVPGTPI